MAFDEWIERAHGKENHSPQPHPKKKVEVRDTPQGYFLTVSRGDKVIESRGPSASMRYIMNHALEHCGFDDEPKTPTIIDRCESREVHSPRADWSEGSYHYIMRKAANAKRKQYGTNTTYNGY